MLKERKFDGSDGMIFFDLLRSLVREENLAAMSEAQLCLAPQRMLQKTSHDHFVEIRDFRAGAGESFNRFRQIGT